MSPALAVAVVVVTNREEGVFPGGRGREKREDTEETLDDDVRVVNVGVVAISGCRVSVKSVCYSEFRRRAKRVDVCLIPEL